VKYLKIELHSKVAALGMLARYHNFFKRCDPTPGKCTLSKQEGHTIAINPQYGYGQPLCPKSRLRGRRGVKSTATNGAGSTNAYGSDAEPGEN
jgi:hypothetical protein